MRTFIIDGGQRKPLTVDIVSYRVMELYERSLENILSTLRSDTER